MLGGREGGSPSGCVDMLPRQLGIIKGMLAGYRSHREHVIRLSGWYSACWREARRTDFRVTTAPDRERHRGWVGYVLDEA